MDDSTDPEAVARRLRRERKARREAEEIAERVTRDLYEAVQQLAASKAVLDETMDFVAVTDVDGRASYLNLALSEFLGIEHTESPAVNVFDVLSEQSRARLTEEVLPVLAQKGAWRGELAWLRRDGGEIAVSQVLIAHRGPDGRVERISSISRDVSEQRAYQELLAHQAMHDPLTGLPNRRLFFDRLDLAVARAGHRSGALGLLYVDLDDFKHINDSFGHDAGDRVLVEVAARLRANVRQADVFARMGGDEFAVLCEEVVSIRDAVDIADRLLAAIADPITIEPHGLVRVGASIGIAVTTTPVEHLEELLHPADAAMYRAKAAGGNQWCLVELEDGTGASGE